MASGKSCYKEPKWETKEKGRKSEEGKLVKHCNLRFYVTLFREGKRKWKYQRGENNPKNNGTNKWQSLK